MKRCNQCGGVTSDWYAHTPWACRSCVRKYQREYRRRHPEAVKETVKNWKDANPEKVKEYARVGQQRRRQRLKALRARRGWCRIAEALPGLGWTGIILFAVSCAGEERPRRPPLTPDVVQID